MAISYVIVWGWLIFANIEGQTGIIVCPSKLLYHLPCPGCGITRATLKFLNFEMLDALRINPNVIFSIIFLICCPIILFADYVYKSCFTVYLYDYIETMLHKKIVWIPFFIFEILIWLHNIGHGV